MYGTQHRDRCWVPLLGVDAAAQALRVAKEVAGRLRRRARVLAANQVARQQTHYPKTVYWEPLGVAQGDAGLALMCSYLDACFPFEQWDVSGHEYLTYAATAAERVASPPLGLFAGLAGLAFSAHSLDRAGTRYQRLLDTLDTGLSNRTLESATALIGRHGVAAAEFDLISGLTGVGAYLLSRGRAPHAGVALKAVLESLVSLTATTNGIPNWYTPQHLLAGEGMAELYPEGNLNCGLAHGVPGPLALMSLALESGVTVAGLRLAVERTAAWIGRHRTSDQYGVNWPTAVPYSSQDVTTDCLDSSRAAWCYGAPGVARALWLAGRALGDKELGRLGIEGMAAVFRRPVAARQIDSPTFCHGVAGMLQITLRFAHDTGLPMFAQAASELCDQLLSLYDPERMLGFSCIEPEGNLVDQPGLLDGAPGVVLTLLAAATKTEPAWDRLFLLS
jgi:hypothetical protein